MRDYFKSAYAKHFGIEVEVHVRVVIRKKINMRERQQIEESYYTDEKKKMMEILKGELQKQGKFIK